MQTQGSFSNQQYDLVRSKLHKLSVAVAFCLLSISANVKADDIEHILVLGRADTNVMGMPADISVIDASDIALSGVTNLTELLRNTSGIQVSDNNTSAVFSMRGFGSGQAANNTLILLDGRRLNNIDIAAPNLNAIPLSMVKRVEILNGSAGVLYGDQAVGGVINIITRAPERAGGNFSLSGGSFDTAEVKGDIAGQFADNWHYFFSGNYKKSDNFRRHNLSKTGAVLGRVGYQDEMTDFYFESSYFDNNLQTPGALTKQEFNADPRQSTPQFAQDYQHGITTALRSGIAQQINDHWQLAADINYRDTLVNYASFGYAGHNKRSQLIFTPKAIAAYPTSNGDLTMVLGTDIHRGMSRFSWGRRNTQTQISPFVQAKVPLTPALSYIVGGRYAEVKDKLTDPAVYPTGTDLHQHAKAFEFGLNYFITEANRVYLRAEDNFRFAKVDEQAYTLPNVHGLKPQTGRSYELGWDYSYENLQARINLYWLDLEDEIVFDPTAQKPVGGAFNGANINAESSRRYGANIGGEWRLAQDFLLGGEYSYIDAKFTRGINKGKALSWVARNSGRIYASWELLDKWQLYSDISVTGNRYLEGDNANAASKLPSYTLLNLALNYHYAQWQASLRADNLLNKIYASSGIYNGLSGSNAGSYYTGSGRAIRLTLGYNF